MLKTIDIKEERWNLVLQNKVSPAFAVRILCFVENVEKRSLCISRRIKRFPKRLLCWRKLRSSLNKYSWKKDWNTESGMQILEDMNAPMQNDIKTIKHIREMIRPL
jgi:hypothetical protein